MLSYVPKPKEKKNMANQSDNKLYRIGKEGFEIIDQFFGRKGEKSAYVQKKTAHIMQRHVAAKGTKPINHCIYHPQESHVYYANPAFAIEATVTTGQASALPHEEVMFTDFSMKKQQSNMLF